MITPAELEQTIEELLPQGYTLGKDQKGLRRGPRIKAFVFADGPMAWFELAVPLDVLYCPAGVAKILLESVVEDVVEQHERLRKAEGRPNEPSFLEQENRPLPETSIGDFGPKTQYRGREEIQEYCVKIGKMS